MIFIVVYCLLMLIVFVYNKNGNNYAFFKSKGKVSWMISGLSLYMFYLSADQGQFIMGLIAEHGMSGLWMVWVGIIGSFVVPIVFAPLWQKLDFITDNQFLLFRFPGTSGRILHVFRAVYVGGLVVALSLCFHLIGFSRILEVFFKIDSSMAIYISAAVLGLFALKNVFEFKLKMDAFHAILFFLSLLIMLYFLGSQMSSFQDLVSFFENNPDKRLIFPKYENQEAWFTLVVFLGIQWWSCYLFDGGGPEMSRFTSVEGKKNAIWTGLLPIGISFIIGFLVIGHILVLLGFTNQFSNPELQYVESVFNIVPDAFHGLIFLGFFGMFITTADSLLNWGASFLTVDVYKGYLKTNSDGNNLKFVSYGSMVLLSLISLIFALNIDSLQSLVKITFSIAAGVAPVYILRWIWFRINAWSQLSAMFSSAIFTLIYPYWHKYLPFTEFPESESRVIVVTLLTSFIWILVTFLTPNQSEEVKMKMLPIIESRLMFFKRFVLAIALGVGVLIVTVLIWFGILNG